ncbi:MAG: aconitate hydratase AcnA [Myxococcales bacterium]|nr:aconitate hydratase AcnA [Myxococcales bacterium]
MSDHDPFRATSTLDTGLGPVTVYRLDRLSELGLGDINRLPYSIKVLLEAVLRNVDGFAVTEEHVKAVAAYNAQEPGDGEIPFLPGRVVLQDFTGVPAVVDLAALRSAMSRLGGDTSKVNPLVPCDLVIDHSVQVDHFGTEAALAQNAQLEFERNGERYAFLKWGQKAFRNFRVVPPATGIVHQVNLEHLADVVLRKTAAGLTLAYPDSVVGTDSHTTMINGLGVLGWGVGGIEAEAVMLGQPIYMLLPKVVGFKLSGKLREGTTATDLVLTVTQILRKKGVVEKFVEFFGPGLAEMSVENRATIANMAPEYGATCGFFPIDEQTLRYLESSGRAPELIDAVEKYAKLQGLWRDDSRPIVYSEVVELDMGTVQPCLAGPARPQDRVLLSDMKGTWNLELGKTYGKPEGATSVEYELDGVKRTLRDGDVVLTAITSCTNTSNPNVLIAAGLLARKARAFGLNRKPWCKTSMAPGSRVVTDYLDAADLTADLDALGFNTVGYGCTTCIGNSGPLIPEVEEAVRRGNLAVAAVISGNRNFEGRVNPLVKPSYLGSPPLCVAYAIAGTVDIDLERDPIGQGKDGNDVYLKDIWPSEAEIQAVRERVVSKDHYQRRYASLDGPPEWQAIAVTGSDVYAWDVDSTYVQEPPFFVGMAKDPEPIASIRGARVLAKLGNSVTTDHISPAGNIAKASPAGRYLLANGVAPADFNQYGARRGNDRVMTRGTLANIRIKNELAPGTEGGVTTYLGPTLSSEQAQGLEVVPASGEVVSIYDAAMAYKNTGVPLVILAGVDYGMGSSRDWAAKGTFLLGVRIVIAESFERIHRSNLVGMGVLPLVFEAGEGRVSLGLTGHETFDVELTDDLQPRQSLKVRVTRLDGSVSTFTTTCRIDTPVEIEYYRNGGVLHTVLRRMARA